MDRKYKRPKLTKNNSNYDCSGTNSKIDKIILDTPIGSMVLTACSSGLHSIQHDSSVEEENFIPDLNSLMNVRHLHSPGSESRLTNSTELDNDSENAKRINKDFLNIHLDKAVKWLRTYFCIGVSENTDANGKHEFCFENATEFERKVWNTLLQTRKGETITYRQLAEKAGCPKGSRAVGSEMNKNPILILIPCHRVIRSDGSLGNYNGGTSKKDFLQKIEKDKDKGQRFVKENQLSMTVTPKIQ